MMTIVMKAVFLPAFIATIIYFLKWKQNMNYQRINIFLDIFVSILKMCFIPVRYCSIKIVNNISDKKHSFYKNISEIFSIHQNGLIETRNGVICKEFRIFTTKLTKMLGFSNTLI